MVEHKEKFCYQLKKRMFLLFAKQLNTNGIFVAAVSINTRIGLSKPQNLWRGFIRTSIETQEKNLQNLCESVELKHVLYKT